MWWLFVLASKGEALIPSERHLKLLFDAAKATDWNRLESRLLDGIRRNALGPEVRRDGFPGGGVSPGGEDAGSSTETAALSNRSGEEDDRQRSDVVYAKVDQAVGHLRAAVRELQACRSRLNELDEVSGRRAKESSVGSCQACDRPVAGTEADRLRAGYCSACFTAWCRAGRPDRLSWERDRRRENVA